MAEGKISRKKSRIRKPAPNAFQGIGTTLDQKGWAARKPSTRQRVSTDTDRSGAACCRLDGGNRPNLRKMRAERGLNAERRAIMVLLVADPGCSEVGDKDN
jgi:hypothetical protein